MKIGVLVKQVPDTASKIRLSADAKSIATDDIKWILNPYDEFAVEQALKIKEAAATGEVVVLSLGPKRTQEAMRTAMAMGADRGLHLEDVAFEGSDTLGTAKALAKIIQSENFNFVLCGKVAVDDDNGQMTQVLAEVLGWSHVQPVVKMEVSADKSGATVNRMIGGGSQEVIDVKFPCVLGCEKGLNEPRYASLPGIMKAKKKPLDTKTLSDIGLADTDVGIKGAKVVLTKMENPPERQAGKILKGDTAAVVKELLQHLRNEAKVI